ncbi:HNH endonuclease [Oenococcus sicerae]|uniref:HNH endonuclease n=1 Tax=Oenococcus sicerae TaxID=2203724 RepID=UPI0039ECEFA7
MPAVRTCRYPNCHHLVPLPHYYCEEHQALEAEYLKSRMKYHGTHQHSYINNYASRHANQVKDNQTKFYHSKEWQGLRLAVLNKQHYLCQYCLVQGCITPAKIVDHTIPITFDLDKANDLSNLNVICAACHYKKDQFESAYYNSGSGFTHNNVEPITEVKLIDYYMDHLDQIPR